MKSVQLLNAEFGEALPLNSHLESSFMADSEPKMLAAGIQGLPTIVETRPVSPIPPHVPTEDPELLELKNRLLIRSDICGFLLKTLSRSIPACFLLIILQGFHPFGFHMDPVLLNWLCGATIGQSVTFLGVFVKSAWPKTAMKRFKSAQK